LAGPTGPPAGRYIQLTNTLQNGATFFVSSGTVAGPLTSNTLYISGISNGQCLQTGPQGQVFGAGFACGSGGSSGIMNTSTLQSGATAYPDFVYVGTSETINGPLTIQSGNSSGGNLTFTPGLSASSIASSDKLTFSYGNGNYGANFGTINFISPVGVIHPPWFTPGAVIVGSTFVFTGPQESTVTYGLNVGSITIGNVIGSAQCLHADTNGNVTGTGSDCGAGGGGVTVYPASATVQALQGVNGSTFVFTGPTMSTVTYGLAVGSLTVTGVTGVAGTWQPIEGTVPAGVAGYITLAADTTGPALKEIVGTGATFYVATSSVTAVQNDVVGWGPLGQLVDIGPYPTATPGGATNNVQYNGGGATFAGSNAFQVNTGSLTVVSSMSITNSAGFTNGTTYTGYLDVFRQGGTVSGQTLFAVGSSNQPHQMYIQDQQPAGFLNYGLIAGKLDVGVAASPQSIYDGNVGVTQHIDFGSTGPMILQTASPSSSGGDIFLVPEVSTAARFGSTGATISSSMTVTGSGGFNATYGVVAGTGTFGPVAASTSPSGNYTIEVTSGGFRNMETSSKNPRGIISEQVSSDASSAHFSALKARGTPSSLLPVQAGDYIADLAPYPYDGNTFQLLGLAGFQVDPSSTVSVGRVPLDFLVNTSTGSADGIQRLMIRYDGLMFYNTTTAFGGTVNIQAFPGSNALNLQNTDSVFSTLALANSGSGPVLSVSGTGAPPNSQALCLLGGALGHCTSVVGATGGCTCVSP